MIYFPEQIHIQHVIWFDYFFFFATRAAVPRHYTVRQMIR